METFVNLPQPGHNNEGGLKSSRYNVTTRGESGRFLLFNTLTGALHALEGSDATAVERALETPNGSSEEIQSFLKKHGYLVPNDRDEDRAVRWIRDNFRGTDHLNIGLLSTEQCNFRCVYCYESFKRGAMSEEVQEGVIRYVQNNARFLRSLNLAWFGGEPLLARKVVDRLGQEFLNVAKKWDLDYTSGITTNGYFLDEDTATMLLRHETTSFQVTLDGTAATHDKHRKLIGGQGTWDRIWKNILGLKKLSGDFQCRLRVNFDSSVMDVIPELIDMLSAEFANDRRFSVDFFPVGKWGGPNDDSLDVIAEKDAYPIAYKFSRDAVEKGLHLAVKDFIHPCSSMCYAADPRSYVIGADGTVYKCTVVFEDPRNQVGKIRPDGHMNLNLDKFVLWVESDDGRDPTCQECFFRPSCMGSACPLIRLNTGNRPCPPPKKHIKTVMELVVLEAEHQHRA